MAVSKAKVMEVSTAKRLKGVICASINGLKNHISNSEANEKLWSSDYLAIQRFSKKLGALDTEFKEYHFAVNYLLDIDEGKLEEQVILDDHEEKVSNVMDYRVANLL